MARSRMESMEETRRKLIAAARSLFASKGYADTAMEDLTAAAGLTRGALYHHFGGKKGLLEAVIEQIDDEVTRRLEIVAAAAATPWTAFVDELVGYAAMAAEPEIRRIVLLDGPAVLGDPSHWPIQIACVRNTRERIASLSAKGVIKDVDAEAVGSLVSAAALGAALWIAGADDARNASDRVAATFPLLLSGLLRAA